MKFGLLLKKKKKKKKLLREVASGRERQRNSLVRRQDPEQGAHKPRPNSSSLSEPSSHNRTQPLDNPKSGGGEPLPGDSRGKSFGKKAENVQKNKKIRK